MAIFLPSVTIVVLIPPGFANQPLCCLQVRIVRHAFDIVHLLTDSNPIQVLVDAVINRYCLAKTISNADLM